MASEMRPDLLEAMADFAELERLQAERRSGRRTFGHEIGMSDQRLAAAFELMERHVHEGLTLTASACLAGVMRRTLAAWVKLADDRRAPWAGWFDVLMRRNADNRRLVLADLRTVAARSNQRGPCARRRDQQHRPVPESGDALRLGRRYAAFHC
jgi:hypothetical protein